MSESTAEVTRAELPSAPKPKAKKGMNILVSICNRYKQKPLFEEDTTDSMDLFDSRVYGSRERYGCCNPKLKPKSKRQRNKIVSIIKKQTITKIRHQ